MDHRSGQSLKVKSEDQYMKKGATKNNTNRMWKMHQWVNKCKKYKPTVNMYNDQVYSDVYSSFFYNFSLLITQ